MLELPKKRRRYFLKAKEAKRFLSDVSEILGTDIEQFLESKTRVEVNETEAAAHATNSRVYTPDAVVLNEAMGFNISRISTDAGIQALPIIMIEFIANTMPRLAMWDFAFLKEGPMQWFRYCLFCFSAGFIITITLMIVSAMGGVMLSIFSRRGG